MIQETNPFSNETVCLGTLTLNENGEISLISQKLLLDLIRDGVQRKEIPGELFLMPHQSASTYLSIEVRSQNPRDAEIIKLQKERYNAAMRQWDKEGMNEITVEAFRKKYLIGRILIASLESDRHRFHSLNLLQPKVGRVDRRR